VSYELNRRESNRGGFKMSKKLFTCAMAVVALASASPAFAATPTPPPSCTVVTFNVPTVDCLGFFDGNLVTGGGPQLAQALTYVGTLDANAVSLLTKMDPASNPINFGVPLSGYTVIGIHFGNADTGYNGTGFWLLNLPTTINSVTYSSDIQTGISNAGLYLTNGEVPHQEGGVPEPATWATMLLGFGAIAGAMRKRRRATGVDVLRPQPAIA
jgi:hypothetical protein